MARFRNDFADPPEQYIDEADGRLKLRPAVRVLPTLGWIGVAPGQEFTVPDEEWKHWVAGGFTALTPDPESPAAPEPAPAPDPVAAPAAATPQPAAEGTETP
jgi:hypothetical protein